MTDRLYYNDSYLMEFEAEVKDVSGDGLEVTLDRTAFYPTSGGQPHDVGWLGGVAVLDVREDAERIVHVLASPLSPGVRQVQGQLDTVRRLDHMRQHTGQHLLSAVMEERFGLRTVSFHLGADYATVDVEPVPDGSDILARIEAEANARLLENLAVSVGYEDAATAQGLRKAPDREGILRIVSIAGLDRSACGGTHVRGSAEVGMIVLGRTEKVRKALRLEFFCGERALHYLRRRAEEAERTAGQLRERLAEADKRARRLGVELAQIEGRNMVGLISADPRGRKLWRAELEELGDEAKARLNAFTSEPGTIAIFTLKGTGSLLIGAYPGLGLDCGAKLREVLTALGGKGGGTPKSAQGSITDPSRLEEAIALLLA